MEAREYRRRGPKPGPKTVTFGVQLPPDLGEWAKGQPGGMSAMVRRLLAEERGDQVVQVVPPAPAPDPKPPPKPPPVPAPAPVPPPVREEGWMCGACGRVNRLRSARTCSHCRTARP
jgi:hypothetical protein